MNHLLGFWVDPIIRLILNFPFLEGKETSRAFLSYGWQTLVLETSGILKPSNVLLECDME